ncbi:hypothetical protein ACFOMD_09930 [Sphingoaurantiacus capsulatus]|uniref:Uncharacterized protein n=1 Tax=Sphingoaurantiacus capsulatus TaxID=1771310 RepID=A0ABV7X9T0_9SPHN
MKRKDDTPDGGRRAFLRGALLSTAALPVAAVEAQADVIAPKPAYDDIRDHLDHII